MNKLKFTAVGILCGVAGFVAASPFEVVVTETFPGSNSDSSLWKGVQRYGFSGTGASASVLSGIPASMVNDPAGLFFANGELFVGNRHGNTFASSVSRFLYNSSTDSFSANGTITGNGLLGVHGIAMRPGTNDLWASNVNNGLSGFTVTPSSFSNNGTLMSGAKRDVFFSADGRYLYATEGVSGTLQRYDFVTNSFNSYSISGASGLHNGNWRGNHLFISDFGTNNVWDLGFDANGNVVSSSIAAVVSGAIGVAFSPDQQEMFVSSHTGNKIDRFLFNGTTSAWDYESTIATGYNMGDIEVLAVPEPASMAVIGLGVAALLKRRRKSSSV